MFFKLKTAIFLFGAIFIIQRCHSEIPETTVAQYHHTIFKIFFDAALGPDAKENFKTCPGICMPSSTAVFCPKVLDNLPCFTPNTKCCVRKNESEPVAPTLAVPLPNFSTADITKSGDKNVFNASGQNDPFFCPGYCILNSKKKRCESPAVIIPNTSNCTENTVCCDDTRVPTTPKPTKRPKPRPPTTTTTSPTYWTVSTDTRKECPGLCIANFIRFTCYGAAEITDLFKCQRSTTSCCANSNVVHETLAQLYHNQPIPPHGHDISHSHDSLQKYGEHTDSKEGNHAELNGQEEYLCPGVCVENQFTEYCEAYLTSTNLCESGSKCCISIDSSSKPESDSAVITKNVHANNTLPANPAVQLLAMIIKSERSTSTVKPTQTKTTVIAAEPESSTPKLVESAPPQEAIQSSIDSNSTVASIKNLPEKVAAIVVEVESKETVALNTIESTTSQSDRSTTQSTTELNSTVAESKVDQATEKP